MVRRTVRRKRRKSGRTCGGPICIEHPGSLKKYGYDPNYPESVRHTALKKAVKVYGYAEVVRKLNAVRTLTKNTLPKYSRIYDKDLKWLQKIYGRSRG